MNNLYFGIVLMGILAFVLNKNMTKNPDYYNAPPTAKNVLGENLESCCFQPLTGYYRDGYCNTGATDYGVHTVCAVMTEEFLKYTGRCGNDLSTPNSASRFPGLKPGDKWCLCASRWLDAYKAGAAPQVRLEATHIKTLDIVSLEVLKKYRAPKARS